MADLMAPRKTKAAASQAVVDLDTIAPPPAPEPAPEPEPEVEAEPEVEEIEVEEIEEIQPEIELVEEFDDEEDDDDDDDEEDEYEDQAELTTAVGQLAQLLMTEEGEAITDVLSGLRDAIDKQNKILFRGLQLLERRRA